MATHIDFRKFPLTIGFSQTVKNAKTIATKQRPYAYPFVKEKNSSSKKVVLPPPVTAYRDQYSEKVAIKMRQRPIDPTRRHNPQSTKAVHLSRFNEKPVCALMNLNPPTYTADVPGFTPLSTCKSAFRMWEHADPIPVSLRMILPDGADKAAEGVVPTGKTGRPVDSYILLPSTKKKAVYVMTSQAWKMNPRRRRFPLTTTHNWRYTGASEPLTTTTNSTFTRKPLPVKKVGSLTPRMTLVLV